MGSCVSQLKIKGIEVFLFKGGLCLLTEVAESSHLSDKMKVVFDQAPKLEGLGEQGDVVRALENIKEIIARDSMTLADLEQLLAHAQVGVGLKDGYLADVEEKA
ncbi:hypothetical protein Tco_0397048 [Tanacetum coccineum]